jgi:hypothetical protein
MENQEAIRATIANIIRERSLAAQLIGVAEILTELRGRGLLETQDSDDMIDLKAALEGVLRENQDLRENSGQDGIPFYYSDQSLSETYAGILLWKSDGPLRLIAQVVRENSQRYPRPVPADSFLESPFELTREDVAECLKVMAEQEEYRDIAQTATSIGTSFLYSTRHLEPDHASALAEWLDVGQVNNP